MSLSATIAAENSNPSSPTASSTAGGRARNPNPYVSHRGGAGRGGRGGGGRNNAAGENKSNNNTNLVAAANNNTIDDSNNNNNEQEYTPRSTGSSRGSASTPRAGLRGGRSRGGVPSHIHQGRRVAPNQQPTGTADSHHHNHQHETDSNTTNNSQNNNNNNNPHAYHHSQQQQQHYHHANNSGNSNGNNPQFRSGFGTMQHHHHVQHQQQQNQHPPFFHGGGGRGPSGSSNNSNGQNNSNSNNAMNNNNSMQPTYSLRMATREGYVTVNDYPRRPVRTEHFGRICAFLNCVVPTVTLKPPLPSEVGDVPELFYSIHEMFLAFHTPFGVAIPMQEPGAILCENKPPERALYYTPQLSGFRFEFRSDEAARARFCREVAELRREYEKKQQSKRKVRLQRRKRLRKALLRKAQQEEEEAQKKTTVAQTGKSSSSSNDDDDEDTSSSGSSESSSSSSSDDDDDDDAVSNTSSSSSSDSEFEVDGTERSAESKRQHSVRREQRMEEMWGFKENFEWYEDAKPEMRAPLVNQLEFLIKSVPRFRTMTKLRSTDLTVTSWFAVLWMPIHVRTHTPSNSAGAFLCYHLINAPTAMAGSDFEHLNPDCFYFRGDYASTQPLSLWDAPQSYRACDGFAPRSAAAAGGSNNGNGSANSGDAAGIASLHKKVMSAASVFDGQKDAARKGVQTRVPIVGLIPARVSPDIWYRKFTVAGQPLPGGQQQMYSTVFAAPLFLVAAAMQLMQYARIREIKRLCDSGMEMWEANEKAVVLQDYDRIMKHETSLNEFSMNYTV